jgi:adenosylmethionine-8-amino-7-oxononanoate aminotransferase
MMATAKAITNGYFPFGAVMLGEKMVQVFEDNPSARIGHGYTYSGHPVGAAAALACLAETKRLNVIDNAAARGTQLYEGCKALMEKYDVIGDVRGGYGLMTAIEMVSDRGSKTPISPDVATIVQETAYRNGAMVRISGPNLILSPPLVITEKDASTILSALDAGFEAV